jgi:VIT1/CCC1 family predicted Fe2+/Mn2+ transporter
MLRMRHSYKVGFSFGLISGIVTTLGMIVGLHSSTHSKIFVLGGILVIAIADALSDAMGIHFAEESENKHSLKEIWESTVATFLSKFIFALSFVIPILLFKLSTAIVLCIIWGAILTTIFSIYLAKSQNKRAFQIIGEHLVLLFIVVIVTHFVGDWVATLHT